MSSKYRWFLSIFSASEREVNGTIFLYVLTLICLSTWIWTRYTQKPEPLEYSISYLKELEREIEKEETKEFILPSRPFDPNKIEADKWIALGLEKSIAQRIRKYLSKGGKFENPSDLKKIYGFPDDFFDHIKGHLKISEIKQKIESPPFTIPIESKVSNNIETLHLIDLNLSDTTVLKTLPGIGSYRSKMIVKYRELLGGFYQTEQLIEVYSVDSILFEGLRARVKVDTLGFSLKKLKINETDFKKLLSHPYLSYEQVKNLVNFRKKHSVITQKDFSSFPFMDQEEKNKLVPYLVF